MFYSRFHKSKYMCATCHDVSNPILANLGADPTQPLPSELNSAFSYLHVERTFSEFMLSAYGQQGGAPTNLDFQQQGAPDITYAAKCQDCHMRDVVGPGADLRDAVVRPSQSVEHPNSGQPLHDLTGGNAWVSWVLARATPGSPNFIQYNADQLNQGPAVLTLDLTHTVDLLITGPESLTLVTGPSDAAGMAEVTWQTKAPGKRNPGTTLGSYTVQTANVTAAGYHWDGVQTSTTFTIQ